MTLNQIVESQQYNPSAMFDALIEQMGLKNDAALARTLKIAPPSLSKARNKQLPVGPALVVRILEVSDLSITELYALMQK